MFIDLFEQQSKCLYLHFVLEYKKKTVLIVWKQDLCSYILVYMVFYIAAKTRNVTISMFYSTIYSCI